MHQAASVEPSSQRASPAAPQAAAGMPLLKVEALVVEVAAVDAGPFLDWPNTIGGGGGGGGGGARTELAPLDACAARIVFNSSSCGWQKSKVSFFCFGHCIRR